MNANPAVHPPMGGPHMDNRNVASDGSRVDQQVGVHVGDTAFHNERIYHINQGDPPERRHEVALAHLVGGTPRFAEQLLGELLWSGFATTERAYHYFLAVLSDRSFNDIHTDIVNAGKICKSLPQDEWRDVFDVVWQLLEYVRKEFAGEARRTSNSRMCSPHSARGRPEGRPGIGHLDAAARGATSTQCCRPQVSRLDSTVMAMAQCGPGVFRLSTRS
jgi:hypothetical protein